MAFGKDKVNQSEFDSFKKRIETELRSLRQLAESKITDSEELARQAAERSRAYAVDAEQGLQIINKTIGEIDEIREQADEEREEIKSERNILIQSSQDIQNKIEAVNQEYERFINKKLEVDEQEQDVVAKVAEINEKLEFADNLQEKVEAVGASVAEISEYKEEIEGMHSHSSMRMSEIDKLYYEIFGRSIRNEETGEIEKKTDGLRDQLGRSYSDISEAVKELQSSIDDAIVSSKAEFDELLKESRQRFETVNENLTGLLPGAMAQGLSAAYQEKKVAEEDNLNKLDFHFKLGIGFLVVAAFIPILFDGALILLERTDISSIIKDAPKIALLMLPLYAPLLWFAYSTGKKVKLSKRLIEEYTHKEVLGKTFSGLAKQIDSLPYEGEIKEELRTKMLFNILQVSAENPGKLIQDYDKSDHPLMDVLDRSAKLSMAVKNLSMIPGVSSLVQLLSDRNKAEMREQELATSDGLGVSNSLDSASRAADGRSESK